MTSPSQEGLSAEKAREIVKTTPPWLLGGKEYKDFWHAEGYLECLEKGPEVRALVERLEGYLKFYSFEHDIITDGWGHDRHAEACTGCELFKAIAAFKKSTGQA